MRNMESIKEEKIGNCLVCQKEVSNMENVISYTMQGEDIFCSIGCEVKYHKMKEVR